MDTTNHKELMVDMVIVETTINKKHTMTATTTMMDNGIISNIKIKDIMMSQHATDVGSQDIWQEDAE